MAISIGPRINDLLTGLLTVEHRIDPYFRGAFDRIFQRPLAALAQLGLRTLHANPETELCQEVPIPGEDAIAREITRLMTAFIMRQYAGKIAERAGNTKTYGVVRADFSVYDGLDDSLR